MIGSAMRDHKSNDRRTRVCHDDVGLQTDQLLRERSHPIDVTTCPPKVPAHVAGGGATPIVCDHPGEVVDGLDLSALVARYGAKRHRRFTPVPVIYLYYKF
jgi:hypothetical protein